MDILTGQLQHYAWGSHTAIPQLLGQPESQQPCAEYWWGAHKVAPSLIGDTTLDEWISAHPESLGEAREKFGPRLPFLMKLLAAEKPLSIQAHPTRVEAEQGFAREEEQGIPLTARHRNYRDDWPKPEIIIALTSMETLYGFRHPRETAKLFDQLGVSEALSSVIGPLTHRGGSASLAEVFLDALTLTEERRTLVDEVVSAAIQHRDDDGPVGNFARTALELDTHFPGDRGIVAGLLLNRVHLEPGEALFVPAGLLHAYIRGFGVECLANSDNVLRGGLTPKHIDVDELVRVVDFSPTEPVPVQVDDVAPGIQRYRTEAPEFAVHRFTLGANEVTVPDLGPRIVAVVDGHARAASADTSHELSAGQAVFLSAGEKVTISGEGLAYCCSAGL